MGSSAAQAAGGCAVLLPILLLLGRKMAHAAAPTSGWTAPLPLTQCAVREAVAGKAGSPGGDAHPQLCR